jgi:hypothetical protein
MRKILFALIFAASTAQAGIVETPQLWHCLDTQSGEEAKVTDGIVLHMDERDTLSIFTFNGSFIARGQLTSFGDEIYGFDWQNGNDRYGIRITPSNQGQKLLDAGMFHNGQMKILYLCN